MGSPASLRTLPVALTIAGSDSGGGAGIQADLKTFLAMGVHGTSAIVSLTAQNTTGVSAVHDVPTDFIQEQIKQVVTDMKVVAAKTGMLSNADIVGAVAESIKDLQIPNLVVDPVFISKNQDRLLSEKALTDLIEKLLPLAEIVTPNLYEAGALLDTETSTLPHMREAAKRILELGPRAVLIKGGHLEGNAVDVFYDGTDLVEIDGPMIDSPHTHGTGCTLSAGIAAELAKGSPLLESVRTAKDFVSGAIRNGLSIGRGYGPTNHGWRFIENPDRSKT
ncbi:MAG TPA: bifunctional hydroxymethylpyrimidine kinase/phosphomethylpyrimidine kinase [Actinomycetota bacterium]|nr:bifunctional hydroxymethylpyrimidine kinase/phosphomethylpyrimidine kinase [Actinomycetota bacterium]